MPVLDILICGGGIAGPTLALLLSRSDVKHNITIVERSPTVRTTGQQIDLRNSGITVMRRLGLLDRLRDITVDETGLASVDANNKVIASFPVEKGKERQSFSSEYEIMRGHLAEMLYNETKHLPHVKYIFGDRVSQVEQNDNKVNVTFKNGTPTAWYDIVIAADGQRSPTRKIAWNSAMASDFSEPHEGQDSNSPYKSLHAFNAYFTIPASDSDLQTTVDGMARFCNASRGRNLMVRPNHRDLKNSSANLCMIIPKIPISDQDKETRQRLEAAVQINADVSSQKALIRDLFKDAGWEADRLLDGMDASEDFYMQEILQVKLTPQATAPYLAWSRGRVVCLGDAGFAPSPMTGMGTTLAITSAYVLAGEIARAGATDKQEGPGNDAVQAALENYEKILWKFVQDSQTLPPGAPALGNPQTEWGVWVQQSLLSVVSKIRLPSLLGKLGAAFATGEFPLPKYEELHLPD